MNAVVDVALVWLYRVLEIPPAAIVCFGLAVGLVVRARGNVDLACADGVRVPSQRCLTGAQTAAELLRLADVDGVTITRATGRFLDYYDPAARSLRLSDAVSEGTNLTAVCVVAHEVGHALQHHRKDAPIQTHFRDALAIVHLLGSRTSLYLAVVGLVLDLRPILTGSLALFTAMTALPLAGRWLDLDANHRARRALAMAAIVPSEQRILADRILTAMLWRPILETLPRVRPARWRKARPHPPMPVARVNP